MTKLQIYRLFTPWIASITLKIKHICGLWRNKLNYNLTLSSKMSSFIYWLSLVQKNAVKSKEGHEEAITPNCRHETFNVKRNMVKICVAPLYKFI